jgi:hypothetical protein
MLKKYIMINVQSIISTFKGVIDNQMRKPAAVISAIILLCSLVRRPGLSCMISTSKIIQQNAKDGIPTDKMPDGTPNLMNIFVKNIICETYRALKEDANIQIAIPPGESAITTSGGNAGGPVVSEGTNTSPIRGVGLLQ